MGTKMSHRQLMAQTDDVLQIVTMVNYYLPQFHTLVVALMHFPLHKFACVHELPESWGSKIWVESRGTRNKDDCAGEGQQ
jgi:hypothetical protein